MGKPDATCTWGMGYLTKITFHYGVGGPTFISSSLFSFNWQIVVSETKVAFDILVACTFWQPWILSFCWRKCFLRAT